MSNILSIQSSVQGEQSVSKKLSASIIEHLQLTYPGSNIKVRDLNAAPLPHFETAHLLATRMSQQENTAAKAEVITTINELVDELMWADIIVIGVPFYNFHIPSTLKSWLDHIAVPGKTFSYSNGRPAGLVVNKKVYLAIAIGGVYDEGPMKGLDNTEPYMRAFLGLLGMTDVTVFKADGMAIPGISEKHIEATIHEIAAFAY